MHANVFLCVYLDGGNELMSFAWENASSNMQWDFPNEFSSFHMTAHPAVPPRPEHRLQDMHHQGSWSSDLIAWIPFNTTAPISSVFESRFCLGLLVAVESKLQRQGPVVYDDWLHVACSAIFLGASCAWFCSSEFSVRVGAVLSGCRSTCRRWGWALPCVFQSMGVGLALVVPVFARFSVINWAILFCLINRWGNLCLRFEKK